MSDFHFFTEFDLLDIQLPQDAFGEFTTPVNSVYSSGSQPDQPAQSAYNVTSMHKTKAVLGNTSNAYAICEGQIVICPVINSNMLNIILKPKFQPKTGLPKIKYFIYRGILASSLFDYNITTNRYTVKSAQGEKDSGNLIGQLNSYGTSGTAGYRAVKDGGLNYIFNFTPGIFPPLPPVAIANATLDDLFLALNTNDVSKVDMEHKPIEIQKGFILGEFVNSYNKYQPPLYYRDNDPHLPSNQEWHKDQGYFGLEIILENDSFQPRLEDVRTRIEGYGSTAVDKVNCNNRTIILQKYDSSFNKLFDGTDENLYKIFRNKERILNYLDPAAFWGSFVYHYGEDENTKFDFMLDAIGRFTKKYTNTGVGSTKDVLGLRQKHNNPSPFAIDVKHTEYGVFENLRGNEIYDLLLKGTKVKTSAKEIVDVDSFCNESNYYNINTIYIDIRNNYNDSYNYNLDKFFTPPLSQIFDLHTDNSDLGDTSNKAKYLLGKSLVVFGKTDHDSEYNFSKANYDSFNHYGTLIGWPILKFRLDVGTTGGGPSHYTTQKNPFLIWLSRKINGVWENRGPEINENGNYTSGTPSKVHAHFFIKLKLFNAPQYDYSIIYPDSNADLKVQKIFYDEINNSYKNEKYVKNRIIDIERNKENNNNYHLWNDVDEVNVNQSETILFKVYTRNFHEADTDATHISHYPVCGYFKLIYIQNSKEIDLETLVSTYDDVAAKPLTYEKNYNAKNQKTIEILPYEYMDCVFQVSDLNLPNSDIINSYNYPDKLIIKNFFSVKYIDNHRYHGNDFIANVGICRDADNNYHYYTNAINLREGLFNQSELLNESCHPNTIEDFKDIKDGVTRKSFLHFIESKDTGHIVKIGPNKTNGNAITNVPLILTLGTTGDSYENFLYFTLSSDEMNTIKTKLQDSINNQLLDPLFKIYLGFKQDSFVSTNLSHTTPLPPERIGTRFEIYLRGHKTEPFSGKYKINEVNIPTNVKIIRYCDDSLRISGSRAPSTYGKDNYGYSLEKMTTADSAGVEFSKTIEIHSIINGIRGMKYSKKEYDTYMKYVQRNISKVWSNTYLTHNTTSEQFGNRGIYSALGGTIFKEGDNGTWVEGVNTDSNKIVSPRLLTSIDLINATPRKITQVNHSELVFSIGNFGRSATSKAGRYSILDVDNINTEKDNNVAAHEYGHHLGLVDRYGYIAKAENNNEIKFDSPAGRGPIMDLKALVGGGSPTNNGSLAEEGYYIKYRWRYNIMSSQRYITISGLMEVEFLNCYWNDIPVNTDHFLKDSTPFGDDIITIFLTKQQLICILGHKDEIPMKSSEAIYFYHGSVLPSLTFVGIYDDLNGNIINISDSGYNAPTAQTHSNSPPTTSNKLQSPSDLYIAPSTSHGDAYVRLNSNLVNPTQNPLIARILLEPLSQTDDVALQRVLSGCRWINENTFYAGDTFGNYPTNKRGSIAMDTKGAAIWSFNYKDFRNNLPSYFNNVNPRIIMDKKWIMQDIETFKVEIINQPTATFKACKYFINRYILIMLQVNGK